MRDYKCVSNGLNPNPIKINKRFTAIKTGWCSLYQYKKTNFYLVELAGVAQIVCNTFESAMKEYEWGVKEGNKPW